VSKGAFQPKQGRGETGLHQKGYRSPSWKISQNHTINRRFFRLRKIVKKIFLFFRHSLAALQRQTADDRISVKQKGNTRNEDKSNTDVQP
jgi:hypothetical protein